jgi:hypothetical protein
LSGASPRRQSISGVSWRGFIVKMKRGSSMMKDSRGWRNEKEKPPGERRRNEGGI